jgi:hypothetical protein
VLGPGSVATVAVFRQAAGHKQRRVKVLGDFGRRAVSGNHLVPELDY